MVGAGEAYRYRERSVFVWVLTVVVVASQSVISSWAGDEICCPGAVTWPASRQLHTGESSAYCSPRNDNLT